MESTGALAHGVIELTQTLARCTRQIKERGYEKERLSSVQAEFRKHLAWQQQRMHSLQRDVERLHNEKSWLTEKTSEVDQDASLLAHEIRQCRRETEQVRGMGPKAPASRLMCAHRSLSACAPSPQFRRERDTLQSELDTVDAEVRVHRQQLQLPLRRTPCQALAG
jgi:chromosome segregation ATPase